jgi:hypothetical protein
VGLSKKFQAIAESFTGLDRNEIDYPPGEQTKAARRVTSGQAGKPIERERRDPNQPSLEPRTPHHAAARHKPAGANNLIAFPGFADHLVQDAGIVMVIGRINDHIRRRAGAKAGHDCPMSTAALVSNEYDRQFTVPLFADGRQRVVLGEIVTTEADSQRLAVASLSGQQLRAAEVRAKLGGVGGYAPPRGVASDAPKFELSIIFSGGRTQHIVGTPMRPDDPAFNAVPAVPLSIGSATDSASVGADDEWDGDEVDEDV